MVKLAKASRPKREDFVGSTPTGPTNFMGVDFVLSDWIPEGELWLVPARRPEESDSDFISRIIVIKNFGPITQ